MKFSAKGTRCKMEERAIKAVLFDLGNVVVKIDTSALTREWAAAGKASEKDSMEYFLDSKNMNRYMEGKLTSSQFYEKTRRLFKLGLKYNDFYRVWNSIFLPYPEMEELIRAIRAKYPDIRLGLVSNTNESHYEHIREHYEILDAFDFHVVSHVIGIQKPNSKIFQEALRLAGTLARNTFFTDDREDLIAGQG
ncbi:MAG: HAD family phosphatase [Candidatus Omnitrophota bacterium]